VQAAASAAERLALRVCLPKEAVVVEVVVKGSMDQGEFL
jgi:hypothetical protein